MIRTSYNTILAPWHYSIYIFVISLQLHCILLVIWILEAMTPFWTRIVNWSVLISSSIVVVIVSREILISDIILNSMELRVTLIEVMERARD